MKKTLMSIMGMAFMALSTSAMAATTGTAPIAVSATGVISCTSTSTDVVFGNYDGTADLTPSAASAGAQCNAGGVAITISLDQGANFDTANSTRRLANGTNYLNYELYKSNTYTTILGDGTHGVTKAMTTSTVTQGANTAVWGKMLAGQALVAGTYSDTVNVTVTY